VTLIEVLIAVVLVAVASMAGVAYVTRSAQHADWVRDKVWARQKALSILAELRAFVQGGEGEAASDLDGFDDGLSYEAALTITPDPLERGPAEEHGALAYHAPARGAAQGLRERTGGRRRRRPGPRDRARDAPRDRPRDRRDVARAPGAPEPVHGVYVLLRRCAGRAVQRAPPVQRRSASQSVRRYRPHGQRGPALVVESTIASTTEAEQQLAATRRAVERGERVTYEVLEEVEGSRRLFQADATGSGYFAALDLARDAPAADARLPLFDELGRLGPDVAGDPRTGNVLCFVRESDAVSAIADASSAAVRSIDVYRFVCIYPHVTDRQVVVGVGAPPARDLVVWRSVPFPSRVQVMAIADATERASVVADLVGRFGMELAWDPDGAVDGSFYEMASTRAISTTPSGGVLIAEDPDVSDRGRLVYGHTQLAPTDATRFHRRPVLTVEDPATWAPHGFEVKIVGVSGARKVWMHVVVEAQARGGVHVAQGTTVIASPKDL
jgi:hypothetical protein